MKAPFGTPDSRCGTKGVCDENGGCIILKTGQTAVGDGAICGNGFCDMNKGENKLNCPTECDNLPPGGMPTNNNNQNQPYPPGSPNQGQFPGQNQNGFQGQPGQFPGGPGGPNGQMGPGGPSDEEMQKMDEQRFQQMKKGLSQFSKGVDQMKKMIVRTEKKLKQCGVGIPPELKAALDKAPEIVTKIKGAKTPDELEDIMADVEDVGGAMQEWGPRFGDLQRLCNMIKQVDKKLKNVQRAAKRAQSYGKKNPAIQEIIDELNAMVALMADAAKSAKELAKIDAEAALDKIDNEFFGNMEELWNKVSLIDMMRNLKTGLSQADREIRANTTKITQLKKKKVSEEIIEELTGLLDVVKEKVAELKVLSKQKGVDPEEIRFTGEELWQAVAEFENALSEQGAGYYMPTVKGGENVKFVMPEGFMGGGSDVGSGVQSGFGSGSGPGMEGPGGFGGPGIGSGGF